MNRLIDMRIRQNGLNDSMNEKKKKKKSQFKYFNDGIIVL